MIVVVFYAPWDSCFWSYGYFDAPRACQGDSSPITVVFEVLTGPVSWCAKKPSKFSLSTAEGERAGTLVGRKMKYKLRGHEFESHSTPKFQDDLQPINLPLKIQV